jgi:predicted AAA+ superfamily ATPase
MALHPVLAEALTLAMEPYRFQATRRDATLPRVPNKVHSVIGMRRAGKSTYLRQLQAGWREALPPHRVVYLSFDDDRLTGLPLEQLGALLEEYYRQFPDVRHSEPVTWLLDEVQVVPGWDRFVRRIKDTELVEVVVSGSSARMLSREVHTALRGRAMETIIRPFSFREFLRHRGAEPAQGARLVGRERSAIEKHFREYLERGGFPEAQDLDRTARILLLQGYVDTLLFRDVVERFGVAQVTALRWLTRHCLRNPARTLSVHGFHRELKSQGHGLAKDAVYEMLGHLVDAFLLASIPLATDSEARQRSNPRKVYPVDHAVVHAFDASGRANLGHVLETVVHNALQDRVRELGYVKTTGGHEVDFLARDHDGSQELIQVCADPSDPGTLERELRGLRGAAPEHPRATRRLLVLTRDHIPDVDAGVHVQPVYEWLLDNDRR